MFISAYHNLFHSFFCVSLNFCLSIPLCSLPVPISHLFHTSSCFFSLSYFPMSFFFPNLDLSMSLYLCLSVFVCLYVRGSPLVFLCPSFHGSLCPFSLCLISVSSMIFHPPSSLCHFRPVDLKDLHQVSCSQSSFSLFLSGTVPAAPRIGIILPSLQIWKLRFWLLVPGFHLWVFFSTF